MNIIAIIDKAWQKRLCFDSMPFLAMNFTAKTLKNSKSKS